MNITVGELGTMLACLDQDLEVHIRENKIVVEGVFEVDSVTGTFEAASPLGLLINLAMIEYQKE